MAFNVDKQILDNRHKTIHILSSDSGSNTKTFDTSTLDDAISGQNNIVSICVEYTLATGDGTPTAPSSLTIEFNDDDTDNTSFATYWVAFGNGSVKLSNAESSTLGDVKVTFSGLGSAIVTLIKGEGFETTNKHYRKVSGRGN